MSTSLLFNTKYISAGPGKCSSSLGMRGGRQTLSLGDNCVTHGTVQHEFMHALGFHHEQTRSDRDKYIKINYDNIKPEHIHNFNKIPEHHSETFDQSYDILSVMQYNSYSWSANGECVIQEKGLLQSHKHIVPFLYQYPENVLRIQEIYLIVFRQVMLYNYRVFIGNAINYSEPK